MRDGSLLQVRDLHVNLMLSGGQIGVIDGVSFAVMPGEVLALVGESGSGKSVTALSILRLLPRELKIASGNVLFQPTTGAPPVDLAQLPADGPEMRRIRGNRIAMVFQEPMSSFSPLHTIGNQIGDVLRLHRGLSGAVLREAAGELLDRVGISDPGRAIDRYPHEFSGGMRQRAMIAKALACDPALLIADEPTTALDVTIQAQILDLLRRLQSDLGMAIIFITHDLGVVAQMADRVAIMYTGKIVETGTVRDIFKRPKHPYTGSLLQAVPRLGRLRHWRDLHPIQGAVPSLYNLPSGCTFHPRCNAFVAGLCERDFPAPRDIDAGHSVSCHLVEEAPPP
ncbi:MAG: ABC transporter ATP-binding protein [Alphaproteobacteria bacterium]|nr:ABC transporter ATP-binding protein [Alphaproteobacteria bacterium]